MVSNPSVCLLNSRICVTCSVGNFLSDFIELPFGSFSRLTEGSTRAEGLGFCPGFLSC